jgi:hypothetical protein
MYNAAQERLETVLFMVQSAAFNRFRFEEVEAYLCREIERYDRMFPLKEDSIDETRARIEGTIGQMYGFLCDYPEGEIYQGDAELYLKTTNVESFDQNHTLMKIISTSFKKILEADFFEKPPVNSVVRVNSHKTIQGNVSP